jgi:5-methyltetrahydrofolate--homocysteine methyltransferase
LEQGMTARQIIEDGLVPGMEVVGDRFASGEMFIPEMLRSARAMQAAIDLLSPLMEAGDRPSLGAVVIGTIKGDIHDIGKSLVGSMLRGAGFQVIDLGVDVEPQRYVEAAIEHDAVIICLSALLTTTMINMKDVIRCLEEAKLRERISVVVGGAPVTEEFALQIGADGFGDDAFQAVARCRELVKRDV